MTPTTTPEPLYEDLGSECWPEQETPELMRFEDVPAWCYRAGRAANALLIAAGIIALLWVIGAIFVVVHSGRMREILREQSTATRVVVNQSGPVNG
jgi:hypothetical protein